MCELKYERVNRKRRMKRKQLLSGHNSDTINWFVAVFCLVYPVLHVLLRPKWFWWYFKFGWISLEIMDIFNNKCKSKYIFRSCFFLIMQMIVFPQYCPMWEELTMMKINKNYKYWILQILKIYQGYQYIWIYCKIGKEQKTVQTWTKSWMYGTRIIKEIKISNKKERFAKCKAQQHKIRGHTVCGILPGSFLLHLPEGHQRWWHSWCSPNRWRAQLRWIECGNPRRNHWVAKAICALCPGTIHHRSYYRNQTPLVRQVVNCAVIHPSIIFVLFTSVHNSDNTR